jgi:hypothetical protein
MEPTKPKNHTPKKILCLLLFLTLQAFVAHAASIYYVSSSGNDRHSGTETMPLLTIQEAMIRIGSSGGTCIIKEGTYHEEINLEDKENITIKAYQNDHVIIDGSIALTATWAPSNENPNIFVATIPKDIWQLFIDNKQQVAARWPNAQFHDGSIYSNHYWSTADASQERGNTLDTGNLSETGIHAEGAIAVANFGSYKTSALKVLTHSGSQFTYDADELNGYADKHHYYYLENKLELLDQENEWFYNPSKKKLYVWGDPTGKKIQGKIQSYFLTMSGCNNITIEHLNFFATTISATKSVQITINNCSFAYPSSSKRMLGILSAPNVTHLQGSKNTTITNFKFYKCLFEHTEGEALKLKGTNNIIEDCYFQYIDFSCAALSGLGVSILNGGANIHFTKNTFHKSGASATLDLGEQQQVSYNHIWDTGTLQSDGSVIQITRANVAGSEIHHNWIHDTFKSGMRYDAPGSEPWKAGTHGLAHHNVMWHISKGLQIKGNHHQIYNNTFFDNDDFKMDVSILNEDYTSSSKWDSDNPATTYDSSNLDTKTHNNAADRISGHRKKAVDFQEGGDYEYPIPGTKSHNTFIISSSSTTDNIVADMLEDPYNFDFRPKIGSALIDAGMSIPGITDGFTGAAPDIGAYERNDTWKAGITWNPDFYPWSFLTLSTDTHLSNAFKFDLYPNPTNNTLHITSTSKTNKIYIFNALGEKMITSKSTTIDVSALKNGIYVLKIFFKNGHMSSKNFIKN